MAENQPDHQHHQHTKSQHRIVEVNVGGRVFTTRRSTLCAVPGSFLDAIFSGRHAEDVDREGRVFIDRNPRHFELILDWLRDPHSPIDLPTHDPVFVHEVEYYGLADAMLGSASSSLSSSSSLPLTGWRARLDGGALYAIGGRYGRLRFNTVERYHVATKKWTAVAGMLTERSELQVVAFQSAIYALGGVDANGAILDTVERYDPTTDTWTAVAPMSRPRAMFPGAVVGDYLYVLDADGHHDIQVERYHAASNTWSFVPGIRSFGCLVGAAALEGKLYTLQAVYSGRETSQTVIHAFDPAANAWTEVSSSYVQGSPCGLGALGGQLALFIPQPVGCIKLYDVRADAWSTSAPIPTPRYGGPAVAALEGRVCVLGGHTEDGSTLTVVEEYDVRSEEWHALPHMPTRRSDFALTVL